MFEPVAGSERDDGQSGDNGAQPGRAGPGRAGLPSANYSPARNRWQRCLRWLTYDTEASWIWWIELNTACECAFACRCRHCSFSLRTLLYVTARKTRSFFVRLSAQATWSMRRVAITDMYKYSLHTRFAGDAEPVKTVALCTRRTNLTNQNELWQAAHGLWSSAGNTAI